MAAYQAKRLVGEMRALPKPHPQEWHLFRPPGPCRDVPRLCRHTLPQHTAPNPGLQALGNAGLRHPRDDADFVFFKIGRQQEHRCFWLVATNRIQGRHQSIAVAGHIHASNHKSSRLWNQLTGVINGLVTAARSRRLPKLFGAVTKRNQLRVDGRPSRQGDGGRFDGFQRVRQELQQIGRHWFWRLHRFHC